MLHFPFQLAIVGVVEGAQQIALARYTIKNARYVTDTLLKNCFEENLEGAKLRDKLMYLLNYFELDKKLETKVYYDGVRAAIFRIGNTTNICSPVNATSYAKSRNWPDDFVTVDYGIANGLYTGLGMKLPADKVEEYSPLYVATQGWRIVYMYFWASFVALIFCLIIFLILIRRHKADLFDFTSIFFRVLAIGVGAAMLGLISHTDRLYAALGTPMLLPICVILLSLIIGTDKLSAIYCNWNLKKNGQPYVLEVDDHAHGHGHGHKDSHGEHALLRGHGHHDSVNLEDSRKNAHYSVYSDTAPLTTTNTAYNNGQHGYPMEALATPPLMSPDPTRVHEGGKPVGPGGYMPVSSGQNYGA